MPVLISPTGVQAVHPDVEVAVARAAARGTVMRLSAFGSKPIEEVVAANPRTMFQVYWCGSRDRILQRLERARAVLIGRAYLWGLAANGQAGVENVLDVLQAGIDSALLGLGRASIAELTPDDVLMPTGFSVTAGASE